MVGVDDVFLIDKLSGLISLEDIVSFDDNFLFLGLNRVEGYGCIISG